MAVTAESAYRRIDNRTAAAFVGAVAIGGANFVAVSISNKELPPLSATLRFALAALLFLAIAGARHVPLVRGRLAAGAVLYGLLNFGAAYALPTMRWSALQSALPR